MGPAAGSRERRNMRVIVGSFLAVLTVLGAIFFGPWIWALFEIESDERDEQQATERFVAEMRTRSSLENVDAKSDALIAKMAEVITGQAPSVVFPGDPGSGLDNCLRYLTDGKRINGRSLVGAQKIPDDSWRSVRDRVVSEAQAFEITRIEVDENTPRAQVLRLSDAGGDIELTVSNTNPEARAIISVSTDCHLPEAELNASIVPTS